MDDDELYELNHFNITTIRPGSIILIIGDNDVLADRVTRDICQTLSKETQFVNVYAPSERFKNTYTNYIPSSCIYHELNTSNLLNLFKRQRDNIKKCTDLFKNKGGALEIAKNSFNTLLILDRCARENSKWVKDAEINSCFEYARDMHMTIIIRSIESGTSLPKMAKHKYDYCFVLTSSSATEHSKIYNAFAGMAPSLKDLRHILNANVKTDQCLVIDRRATNRDNSSVAFNNSNTNSNTADSLSHDITDTLGWTKNFARFKPVEELLFLNKLGIPKLWEHDFSNRAEYNNAVADSYSSNHIINETPDIGHILQNFSKGQKLRIQIVPTVGENHNNTSHNTSIKNWIDSTK